MIQVNTPKFMDDTINDFYAFKAWLESKPVVHLFMTEEYAVQIEDAFIRNISFDNDCIDNAYQALTAIGGNSISVKELESFSKQIQYVFQDQVAVNIDDLEMELTLWDMLSATKARSNPIWLIQNNDVSFFKVTQINC